jgi:hypothetical protein
MQLKVFDDTQSQFWNSIIERSTSGTLFHTWEWLKIVEKHSDARLIPLVFFDADDDKPFGAIPLFFMKKLGLKMVFSPPPGSSITLGPVVVEKGYRQHKFEMAYLDFQQQLDLYIEKLGINYTNILTSPGLKDVRPFSWAGYKIKPAYTYKTDLRPGEQELWGNLSRSLRQSISRARAKGTAVVPCDMNFQEEVDYIYESLVRRYNKQHVNVRLKKLYIENILRQFGGSSVKVLLAKYNGNPVGWQILVVYKDRVSGWMGGVRSETNSLDMNGLSWWEVTAEAARTGYKWLEDMGANTPNICSYKSKFNPVVDVCFEMKKTDIWGLLAEKAYYLRKGSSAGKYQGLKSQEDT